MGNLDLEVAATTLNRVLELQKLPNEVREKLYYFIDMSIRDFKLNKPIRKQAQIMSLSIFDIAKGISWTDRGHFYLIQKEDKYELIVDYLNSAGNKGLEHDLKLLRAFYELLINKSEKEIDNYIVSELEGFQEVDNEWYAKIAGAHDLSPTILYKKGELLYIKHPNIPAVEKFEIDILDLIKLQLQMIEVNKINTGLKTLEK